MMCAQSEAQLFLFICLFFIAAVRWLQALLHLVGQIGYLAGSAVLIVSRRGRRGLSVCFLHNLLHSNNLFLSYMRQVLNSRLAILKYALFLPQSIWPLVKCSDDFGC